MTKRRTTARIPRTRGWGLALALATACISGVAIFVNAHFVGKVGDATAYTTAKNAVAAALLLGVLGAGAIGRRGRGRATRRVGARGWAGLVALGVIGGSVPFVLFFEGLARAASPVQAGFIHKTLVVWVALLAVPLLRERFTAAHAGAIVLLVAGQAVLVADFASFQFGIGEAMVLAATLLWSVEFVLAKRLLDSTGSLTVGAARLGIGILLLGGYVLASGRAGAMAALTGQEWTWAVVTGVILAGFVASWYAALARAQAIDVTAVLVFGQVVTAALAAGFTGVSLQPDLVGLGLILAGVAAAGLGALRVGAPAGASTT
ncbi:MAG TPA: EamA family transporter [Egibacteraceae bacterium]|nr:EamA family transporter [Egibacteraceae bacterium]